MADGFKGKTAVITGGATGMGFAVAQALASAGANVVIAGRRRTEGEAAAQSLGPSARFVVADVRSDNDVRSLFDGAASSFGGVDFLLYGLLDLVVDGHHAIAVRIGAQAARSHFRNRQAQVRDQHPRLRQLLRRHGLEVGLVQALALGEGERDVVFVSGFLLGCRARAERERLGDAAG